MGIELRIINHGGKYHAYKDGNENGFQASSVVEAFSYYFGEPTVTEQHTFEIVESRLFPSMCLWLYGNENLENGWWFAQIGGVVIEPDKESNNFRDSHFRAVDFRQYSVGASRVNWTDAISRIQYEYQESLWWRDIHNAGTGN